MYITETGIADSRDDRRALFIDSYFKEVSVSWHAQHDCGWVPESFSLIALIAVVLLAHSPPDVFLGSVALILSTKIAVAFFVAHVNS
jgi:hypothetical protein